MSRYRKKKADCPPVRRALWAVPACWIATGGLDAWPLFWAAMEGASWSCREAVRKWNLAVVEAEKRGK